MPNLTGKELEELVLWRAREADSKLYTLGRYGVMAVMIDGKTWTPISSLPDYEGLLAGVTEVTKAYRGVQFVFDCKVSSQAALELPDINMSSKSIVHQIKHLLKRQRYGALSFLLIHFNERKLATKTDKELTVIFPVCDNAFWKSYLASEQKKISRSEAKLYGIEVVWDLAENKRTESPNLYAALETMVSRVTEANKQQSCKE